MSPELFIKPFQDCGYILDIFLSFLPHVKDWTVFARAQDILEHKESTSKKHAKTEWVPDVMILDIADTGSTILRTGLASVK